MVAHDWARLGDLVTEDVVRIGPFSDEYRGRDAYLAFLRELMPTLSGYSMQVDAVTYTPDRRRAFAELTETVAATVTAEVLVFELTPDGQISRVAIYIRHEPG